MSLDVYLTIKGAHHLTGDRIFIREDGRNIELTRAEWDARFPGREPFVVSVSDEGDTVFSANITHNLGKMADEACLYQPLWRPDEIGITHAEQLITPLRAGLALLEADPKRFEQFNALNGWGTYDALVRFVAEYLAACEQYPSAEVSVWR